MLQTKDRTDMGTSVNAESICYIFLYIRTIWNGNIMEKRLNRTATKTIRFN